MRQQLPDRLVHVQHVDQLDRRHRRLVDPQFQDLVDSAQRDLAT